MSSGRSTSTRLMRVTARPQRTLRLGRPRRASPARARSMQRRQGQVLAGATADHRVAATGQQRSRSCSGGARAVHWAAATRRRSRRWLRSSSSAAQKQLPRSLKRPLHGLLLSGVPPHLAVMASVPPLLIAMGLTCGRAVSNLLHSRCQLCWLSAQRSDSVQCWLGNLNSDVTSEWEELCTPQSFIWTAVVLTAVSVISSRLSSLCSADEGYRTRLAGPRASQEGGELDAPRGSLLRRDTPSPSAFQRFRVTSLPRDPAEEVIPEHEVRQITSHLFQPHQADQMFGPPQFVHLSKHTRISVVSCSTLVSSAKLQQNLYQHTLTDAACQMAQDRCQHHKYLS